MLSPCPLPQSISGITSPVQSVGFNNTENWIGAGSKSGVIKVFDMEENKSECTGREGGRVSSRIDRVTIDQRMDRQTDMHKHVEREWQTGRGSGMLVSV